MVFSEKKADVDDIHEYLLLKGVQKNKCPWKSQSAFCCPPAFLFSHPSASADFNS
jgi:hypothetical protein